MADNARRQRKVDGVRDARWPAQVRALRALNRVKEHTETLIVRGHARVGLTREVRSLDLKIEAFGHWIHAIDCDLEIREIDARLRGASSFIGGDRFANRPFGGYRDRLG